MAYPKYLLPIIVGKQEYWPFSAKRDEVRDTAAAIYHVQHSWLFTTATPRGIEGRWMNGKRDALRLINSLPGEIIKLEEMRNDLV